MPKLPKNLKQTWQYGVSPHPKSWGETAEILKGSAPKKKKSGLYERLLALETASGEKK